MALAQVESKIFDSWTDKKVERIAKAYENGDYDKYEDLLDRYSGGRPELYNMLEDRVTDFRLFGSHEIG